MTIFERTKQTAKERGLTLRQVEEKAGLSNGSLYNWKKSSPKIENVKKVADVLGVSVDYLLGNGDRGIANINNLQDKELRNELAHGVLDLREVTDDERYNMVSAGGRPITDEDWAVIKAILAKYPKHADED
ncbi:helix-turn-helix transcriptional regulator [Weissella minor]|uniref:helix-turn-helix domain-containing protein n=1 Tax=Weissella minor TaxID=1620 RepID=UPI001BAFB374|nr:helix-turn-helix transcriptional regulator [Weissella minor]MBS0950220.1 helix-turn-helix transcriptional regulator [Weissella minor]